MKCTHFRDERWIFRDEPAHIFGKSAHIHYLSSCFEILLAGDCHVASLLAMTWRRFLIQTKTSMKRASIAFIIHIFALLHAVVALSCRLGGIEDELLLTILTMAMILLICLKKKLNIEFTAASVIVANIIGYLMGNIGAEILDRFIHTPWAVHAMSTAVTTEVLGWSIVAFTRLFRREEGKDGGVLTESYLKWILFAIGGIFVMRIGVMLLFDIRSLEAKDMLDASARVLSNSLALITILCLNILYVRFIERAMKELPRPVRLLVLVCFMGCVGALEALVIGLGFPAGETRSLGQEFPSLFVTSLLVQVTVYCLVFMANYAMTTRTKIERERGKANMAQYRYMKLKHQVNPHFLFNSLNILDCLVCEEKAEEASTYIHKLAGIYRYMIKSEDEDVVPLRDELGFVEQYIDLLSIRFPAGLDMKIDVPEEMMMRYVLPCAVQLLIENATKHNSVSTDNPLTVRVGVEGDRIVVTNNIVPKVGRVESTGLGLKYLRQQYMDVSGKLIVIEHTERIFKVTLPLI